MYRSQDWIDAWQGSYPWRVSASYVTGGHSLKIGYQGTLMTDNQMWFTNNQGLTYRLNNGVPNQITMRASPVSRFDDLRAELGLFVQDRWTVKRLTANLGVRMDRLQTSVPDQVLPGSN